MSKLNKFAALQQRIGGLNLDNIRVSSSDAGSSRNYCYARITVRAYCKATNTEYESSFSVSGVNHRHASGNQAGAAFANWQGDIAADKLKAGTYTATSKLFAALVELCELVEDDLAQPMAA